MAELRNDSGALRFVLELVAREGGAPAGAAEAPAPAARLLAACGLDYLDQRDREWWPLLRLPPGYLPEAAVGRLQEELSRLLSGAAEGFAWRAAEAAPFGLQLSASPGGGVAEVGLDLGAFLADAGGVPWRLGAELALVRFQVAQAELVRFADALGRELETLGR
jgi:hypothetical protein